MAAFGEIHDLAEEIAFLESMFGGTVSSAVITSVLESCQGNVHLAADAIMNFSEEMSTTQTKEAEAESNNQSPIRVPSTLNVAAPPFEIGQLPTNATNQPPITSGQEVPISLSLEEPVTTRQQSPSNARPKLKATRQHSPSTTTLKQTSLSSHSPTSSKELPTTANQQSYPPYQQSPAPEPLSTVDALSVSFSQAFRNSGALPKKPPDSKSPKPRFTMNVWPDQVGRILNYHNQGTRTLIIMRGPAGSGKTYLARHLVDYTIGPSTQNYGRHIFSSDNYFMINGVYQFNRESLEQAHIMNQRRVCEAANNGVSPIIVDNTNTELWEMEPYIRDGVRNGYIIEFAEPNTAWARNVNQLANRNTHGVSRESIRRMLDRYDKKITPEVAIKKLRLTYPPNKKPPVQRNIPPFSPLGSPCNSPKRRNPNNGDSNAANIQSIPTPHSVHHASPTQETANNASSDFVNQASSTPDLAHQANLVPNLVQQASPMPSSTHQGSPTSHTAHHEIPTSTISLHNNTEMNQVAGSENISLDDETLPNDEHNIKIKKIIEAQQQIEHFEKVEREWENGESWDSTNEPNNNISRSTAPNPKPPRRANDAEKLIKPSSICDDWTKIAMFMPPWQDEHSSNPIVTVKKSPVHVESTSVGTGFEIGDLNEHMHKVLYCIPRDINQDIPEKNKPKIPHVVMFDKSTSTHENDFLSMTEACKNKESHFRELRRMFRFVPSDVLRDMFESCNFDVIWTVDLVLESYPEGQKDISINSENDSDSEEDGEIAECNCLTGFSIPDVKSTGKNLLALEAEPSLPRSTPVAQKKPKRENKLSDNTLQLKRQIESNVMISDSHYSQHYLNMRRRREINIGSSEGTSGSASNVNPENAASTSISGVETAISENATVLLKDFTQNCTNSLTPVTPSNFRDVAGPSTSYYNFQFMDADPDDSDTESDSNKSDNLEKTVTINLGHEFLEKLDELFGRKGFQYPENIQPVVNLPMSILQQINAHWSMSVASQLDDGSRQSEAMIKQDEEFARQLAAKEQELTDQGKEPEIPSLKEIMDMEMAYAIYERSIAEWRNNEPQDFAAKLTREKLYNLFPDLSKDVLSEMLMAHDYSFKSTIESLIISTGQAKWLEDEKGVEKFVMHKEMERKEKFVEEQKKNLDETEWPYLSNPKKPITLETVHHYRTQAEESLQNRNRNFEKAGQYLNSCPPAASFYSGIAALHTQRYERYSSLAAAYLMNYHLKNNPDHDVLDLHYLRVAEAMVNLDIFIDQIVLQLRTKSIRSKEIWIITGKGLHSVGGPRIKPAARRRLKEREIMTKQVNGGLIMALLRPTDKMSSEM